MEDIFHEASDPVADAVAEIESAAEDAIDDIQHADVIRRITALESHSHDTTHTHSEFALGEHGHDTAHSHTEFASTDHAHEQPQAEHKTDLEIDPAEGLEGDTSTDVDDIPNEHEEEQELAPLRRSWLFKRPFDRGSK